jgi:hypothetical protein
LLAQTLPASAVHAGGVVSVCDEAHLKLALTGGGTVNFSCSGTITLTGTITISKDTTIDGSGHSVILSGAHQCRVFTVSPGITLSLNRLTIADGVAPGPYGGGVFIANGTLIVSNNTFLENGAANAGGGIYGKGSQVTVSNSALTVSKSTFYDSRS